jgi:hypothetical protein
MDYVKTMFGQNAQHVPAWLYIQDAGHGVVTFAGSSMSSPADHPLRYASPRTHQFIVGEIIVRPHLIVATDALRGKGLANLITIEHDIDRMLTDGEILLGRRP